MGQKLNYVSGTYKSNIQNTGGEIHLKNKKTKLKACVLLQQNKIISWQYAWALFFFKKHTQIYSTEKQLLKRWACINMIKKNCKLFRLSKQKKVLSSTERSTS